MRALSLVVGGALQDGLNALPNSCLDVQLYVVLEVLVFGGQVSPSSLETHKLPDTIFFWYGWVLTGQIYLALLATSSLRSTLTALSY